MPRADDEHMSVPVWRMKQLQDIEHAAREAVETLTVAVRRPDQDRERSALLCDARDGLVEALKE
jgi:hypothetical protein